MLKEIKGKVKEKATEAKDFVVENKEIMLGFGVIGALVIGSVVHGRHVNKKYEEAWRNALKAYKNGDLDYDFGPYKVMKIFEPNTGEFIGETVCHEDTTNAFISLK